MNDDEIRTILANLPTTVRGFSFIDSTGSPCIVLNARMTAEIQNVTYLHELEHIRRGDNLNPLYLEYSSVI